MNVVLLHTTGSLPRHLLLGFGEQVRIAGRSWLSLNKPGVDRSPSVLNIVQLRVNVPQISVIVAESLICQRQVMLLNASVVEYIVATCNYMDIAVFIYTQILYIAEACAASSLSIQDYLCLDLSLKTREQQATLLLLRCYNLPYIYSTSFTIFVLYPSTFIANYTTCRRSCCQWLRDRRCFPPSACL